MEDKKGSGFLIGLLTGTIVGAAIAVLMAPATGEETRKYLKEKAYEPTKSKVTELTEELRTKAADLADDVKEKASHLARDLKERAEELWENTKQAAQSVDVTVNEKKDDIKDYVKRVEKSRLT